MRENWGSVTVRGVKSHNGPVLSIGDTLHVEAEVDLGAFVPEELAVELYYGTVSSKEEFESPIRVDMQVKETEGKKALYEIKVPCKQTGRQGYAVRILPKHDALVHQFLPGLVKWAESNTTFDSCFCFIFNS